MENTEINRLDFSNIVQKQLDKQKYEKKFLRPSQVHLTVRNKTANATAQAQIKRKIDYIFTYVHTQLLDKKAATLKEKYKKNPKPIGRKTGGQCTASCKCSCKADDIVNNKVDHMKLDIPRLKVLCSQKKKERIRNTIPLHDDNHYVCNKRLEDAKEQHRVFSCMLEDQKQLTSERRLVASEIRTMRSNLNNIRERLDSSMKLLDKKKTYSQYEMDKITEKLRESIRKPQKDSKSVKEQETC